MEVNILAFIVTALFILIPIVLLLIFYVQTISQGSWLDKWIYRYTTMVEPNFYQKE